MSEKMYTLSDLKKMKQDCDSTKQQLQDLVKKWEAELKDIEKDVDEAFTKGSDYDQGLYGGNATQLACCIRELKAIIQTQQPQQ